MELTNKQKQIKARQGYIENAIVLLMPGESITAFVKSMAVKFSVTEPVIWKIVRPYTKKSKSIATASVTNAQLQETEGYKAIKKIIS